MSLLKTATPQEIAQAAELYPSLWVLQHEIKNEAGFPIEFEERKFLWDIYNDLSPHQVILKPPQIGATVMNAIKSFYVAKKLRRQIIYTLPTQGDVQDMVGGSFNRIIAQNPILMSWVKDHDTIEQKSVGDSIIFYRGTFTAKQAMMIPSGLNIHDEVDASDPAIITQYETRLQAQEDGGWRWYFSHPSLAGFGVDVYWQKSDKKEWYITCHECGKEQILEWPHSISLERMEYVCKSCGKALSTEERINGTWKATTEGDFSGYHISQLMLYNKSAKDIIDAYNDPQKDKQYFWNYVLGLPYISSEDQITPTQVLKNVTPLANDQTDRIVIGVDTGLPIYITIGNKQGIFFHGTCGDPSKGEKPYAQLERYLNRWPDSVIVSDQGGDLIGIRELQAKYPGRVFLCYYRKDRKSINLVEWGENDEFGKVFVDRNREIQLIVEQLRDIGRIRFNGSEEDWAPFAAHFGNIYREQITVKQSPEKDDRTLYGAEYVWKRSGPDHYLHSLLYCLVGLDKFATRHAKVIAPDVFDEIPVGRMFDT